MGSLEKPEVLLTAKPCLSLQQAFDFPPAVYCVKWFCLLAWLELSSDGKQVRCLNAHKLPVAIVRDITHCELRTSILCKELNLILGCRPQ